MWIAPVATAVIKKKNSWLRTPASSIPACGTSTRRPSPLLARVGVHPSSVCGPVRFALGNVRCTVPNPAMLLSKVIAQLHDDNLRVAVPGFYDGIRPPDQDRIDSWYALGFDDKAFLATAGRRLIWAKGGAGSGTHLVTAYSGSEWSLCGLHREGQDRHWRTPPPRSSVDRRQKRRQRPRCVEAILFGSHPQRVPLGIHRIRGRGCFRGGRRLSWLAAQEGLQSQFAPAAMVGSGGSIPVCGLIREHLGFESCWWASGLMTTDARSNSSSGCSTTMR